MKNFQKGRMIYILFLILLLFSCENKKQYRITNYSDVNEVISYIKNNLTKYEELSSLKGISSIHLTNEQKIFYRERSCYLIALLRNDQMGISHYQEVEKEYYDRFEIINKNYFYWSRAILDEELLNDLISKFGENCINVKILYEYLKNRKD
ncbi:TPA: hypothetical protein ENS27_12680 [bacterium]|nr:hypothetical protein [bacterium]